MADCVESSAVSSDDKLIKDDRSLSDAAKNQNKNLPPPSLEPYVDNQDIDMDASTNGEIFAEMPVITQLTEDVDTNCKELHLENSESNENADCLEPYENCDDDGDCRNPAEMCESTMIEGSANETWITEDSIGDESESLENSNSEVKRLNSFTLDSLKASNVKDKSTSENALVTEEASPCLLAISDIRQNEPWVSDDSESNLCKQSSSKEEFILAEATCKEENATSDNIKDNFKTKVEETLVRVTSTESSSGNIENKVGNANSLKDITNSSCDDKDSQSSDKVKDISTRSPVTSKDGEENNISKDGSVVSPESSTDKQENNTLKDTPSSPVETEQKQEDKLTIKHESGDEDKEDSDLRKNTDNDGDVKGSEVKSDIEEKSLKEEKSTVKNEGGSEIDVKESEQKCKIESDEMEVDEAKQSVEKEVKAETDCINVSGSEKVNETDKLKTEHENYLVHSKEQKEDESKGNITKPLDDKKDKSTSGDQKNETIVSEIKDAMKADDKKKQKENEAEMKGYITDTMNELLGLFGYDQVDENMKDTLELKKITSSISGTNTTQSVTSVVSKPSDPCKKDRRMCTECNVMKRLKYQVVFQGKTKFLCSDSCFQVFRSKQNLTPTSSTSVTSESSAELCAQCKREIKNGQGYFPTGENKPLCSEDCMQKYQQAHEPKQICTQCKNSIEGRTKCLTWETMEFCSEDCLGKYQTFLGSHCTCCQAAVQRASLGKYCVRFGFDIRQFCSGRCLEEFKKGLKVCSFCQKDLSSGQDGFLAPVGDKGYFKDFCSQLCMERYETMNNTTTPPPTQQCSVCNKLAPVKVQVKYEGKSHALCSEPCIAAFRYANKINTTICDTCHKFFDSKSSQHFNLQFEGSCKRFCTKSCMNLFVLSHRKIVPCTWCKVKKYNFDMIERVDSSNHVQLFCSLNCLSLFRVSLNATSSRSVRCDHCQQYQPAQYHLTMSDASIRNFCCYQCVINFQNQFTHVPTLTTATPSVRHGTPNAAVTPGKVTAVVPTPTPVIASVMSLAPAPPIKQVSLQQSSKPSTLQQSAKPTTISRPQPPPPPPPLVAIATKPQPTLIGNPPTVTVASTGSSPQIIREVIVRPPAPKSLKNKALLCKPIMQTKGISCKPHPCHKAVQTDLEEEVAPSKPLIIPVPLPIFVPAPLHMFSRPVPTPVPFPLPIPVPVFIPTTKTSSSQILKHIKEIQEKIPSNPYEADLLMMAEMVAADGEKEPFDDAPESDALPETPDKDMFNIPEIEAFSQEDISPRSRGRGSKRSKGRAGSRGRGRKRLRIDGDRSAPSESAKEDSPEVPTIKNETISESDTCLKCSFGVNAWKQWVLEKNSQLEKGSQSLRKLKLFKTDILQLSPDELNYSLCLFVKEVRKPLGDEYAPDSIYYLCLGIQQYLFENGRIDNIFTDPYYEKFTECLNEVLHRQENIKNEAALASRIEEEILWDAKQLGAHSPHVLLNTLMYFNTKQFFLKSVEDHMQLSFTHIMKHWKKTTLKDTVVRTVMLRYYPPLSKDASKKHRDEQGIFEQLENVDNPLRCPVKLYEFYLSKCPESVKSRSDVFYLYPERSCVPDSPVWYSTQPLGRDTVAKMLQRIRMVREINEMEEDQKG